MSIYNCHKQQPQPWMSYIASNMICYSHGCCPSLVTNTTSLLPFQVISNGSFIKFEISPHGDNDWTIITIPYTEVYIDGFYFISYNGSAIDELECGAYDFKLTAGEVWYFEPITVKDFTIVENAYTIRDDLMLPFKFSEQQFETSPIIAPCDSFLPFMFSTENATSGTITVYLYDVNAGCVVSELTDIVVTVLTISGKTYYIHEGDCFYPLLECGTYKLEIVDGDHSYFSVPFDAVCDMNDIPDGYRVMLDFNRCVMRDEDGVILYEECSDIQEPEPPEPEIDIIKYGLLYNYFVAEDARNLANTGSHIITKVEYDDLITYLGSAAVAGAKLKEVGNTYWIDTDGTNDVGFNARGGGERDYSTGAFAGLRITGELYTTPQYSATNAYSLYLEEGVALAQYTYLFGGGDKNNGHSFRVAKDSTALVDGEEGTYLGNDGKLYRTICINGIEYIADNLAETKYRNGDDIPEVTGNAAWAALSTGAWCYYNNDPSNM